MYFGVSTGFPRAVFVRVSSRLARMRGASHFSGANRVRVSAMTTEGLCVVTQEVIAEAGVADSAEGARDRRKECAKGRAF